MTRTLAVISVIALAFGAGTQAVVLALHGWAATSAAVPFVP